jgi:hypothetical protein
VKASTVAMPIAAAEIVDNCSEADQSKVGAFAVPGACAVRLVLDQGVCPIVAAAVGVSFEAGATQI